MHRMVDALIIAGPVILGNTDRTADGNAHEQIDDQKDQALGRADCCQGLLPHKSAHNCRVHCTVELLEQIAQKQRHGKGKNVSGNRSLRHKAPLEAGGLTLRHLKTSLSIVMIMILIDFHQHIPSAGLPGQPPGLHPQNSRLPRSYPQSPGSSQHLR